MGEEELFNRWICEFFTGNTKITTNFPKGLLTNNSQMKTKEVKVTRIWIKTVTRNPISDMFVLVQHWEREN